MSIIATFFHIDDVLKDKECNNVVIDGVDIVRDVVYDESNADVLKADLYIPTGGEGKRRVLINIHGGGWISGDKKWRNGFSALMCDNKTFVMNINYGIAPSYPFPYCIANAYKAIDFLVAHAEEYDLDLDHLYLSGDSAGAQIAAFTASIINNKDELNKLNITRPQCDIFGLILFCGAYDMKKLLLMPICSRMCYEITGKKPSELDSYEYLRELNTYYYINDTFPRTLLVSAKLDAFVRGQGDMLETLLINHNIPHIHYVSQYIDSFDHCFHLRYSHRDSKNSLDLAKQFLAGEILQ